MPKYPKNHKDVEYHVPSRKRRIAGSTKATSDFLALVHLDHPDFTIFQLREVITNRTVFIQNPETVAVLNAYIVAGYGNHVPAWDY